MSVQRLPRRLPAAVLVLIAPVLACDGSAPSPTQPSPTSFLAGTWTGTLTIQVNPSDPVPAPATSGAVTWTFEVVPETNLQSFNAIIGSEHAWLNAELSGIATLTTGNAAPADIITLGDFDSPRSCLGTFGSRGIAQATRIEADFAGTDCGQTTFSGDVVLTKVGR